MVNEIRALYNKDTIRVYQAYNEEIANEAVKINTFGTGFKLDRMTWIKPSFLFFLYRCGWGTKEGQERILAIDMDRKGFDFVVQNAVTSTYSVDKYPTYAEWKEKIKRSDIRCQWDPERDIFGNPLGYRAIQLGLRGNAVRKYVEEWITNITDITDYVQELREKKEQGEDIRIFLPQEHVYAVR